MIECWIKDLENQIYCVPKLLNIYKINNIRLYIWKNHNDYNIQVDSNVTSDIIMKLNEFKILEYNINRQILKVHDGVFTNIFITEEEYEKLNIYHKIYGDT